MPAGGSASGGVAAARLPPLGVSGGPTTTLVESGPVRDAKMRAQANPWEIPMLLRPDTGGGNNKESFGANLLGLARTFANVAGNSSPAVVGSDLTLEQRATTILRLAAFNETERLLLRPLLWWVERCRSGNDSDKPFLALLSPEMRSGYDITPSVDTHFITDSAFTVRKDTTKNKSKSLHAEWTQGGWGSSRIKGLIPTIDYGPGNEIDFFINSLETHHTNMQEANVSPQNRPVMIGLDPE